MLGREGRRREQLTLQTDPAVMEPQTEDGHERNWQKGAFFFFSQQSSRADKIWSLAQVRFHISRPRSRLLPPPCHYPTTIGPPNHLHPSFPAQTGRESSKSRNAASPNPLEQKIRCEQQRPRPVFPPMPSHSEITTLSHIGHLGGRQTEGGSEGGQTERRRGRKHSATAPILPTRR